MTTKNIRVFPYTFKFPETYQDINTIKRIFDRSKTSQNVVEYRNDWLLLIIDSQNNTSLFGRFLKLRGDIPSIINKITQEERDIELDSDENIKEESHFMINFQDRLLFGEYNYHAIRHFSFPLMFYLNKIFNSSDVDIRPITDPDTFNNMLTDRRLKEMEISIAQESLTSSERRGIPLFGALNDLASDNETFVKIHISKGKKRDSELNKEKVVEKAKNILERSGDLFSFRVIGENSKYDLLNNSLIFLYSKC